MFYFITSFLQSYQCYESGPISCTGDMSGVSPPSFLGGSSSILYKHQDKKGESRSHHTYKQDTSLLFPTFCGLPKILPLFVLHSWVVYVPMLITEICDGNSKSDMNEVWMDIAVWESTRGNYSEWHILIPKAVPVRAINLEEHGISMKTWRPVPQWGHSTNELPVGDLHRDSRWEDMRLQPFICAIFLPVVPRRSQKAIKVHKTWKQKQ